MYTPYDNYLDQAQQDLRLQDNWSSKENYFMPGKIAAGLAVAGGGMLGLGAVGLSIRLSHNSAMRNRPGYANFINKMGNSKIYKDITHPTGLFSMGGFRKTEWYDEILSPLRKPGIPGSDISSKIFNKMVSPINKYMPTGAGLSSFKAVGNRYVLKLPMFLPGAFIAGISNEIKNNNHSSGLYLGAAKTTMSLVGMGAGQAIGAAIGSAALPVIGTAIGSIVGSAVGSIAGDSVIDTVKWMKSKGRQWGHPELGGGFHDSVMGQTMRARSLNAIQTSQFNLRSSLGNEAARLTMGY